MPAGFQIFQKKRQSIHNYFDYFGLSQNNSVKKVQMHFCKESSRKAIRITWKVHYRKTQEVQCHHDIKIHAFTFLDISWRQQQLIFFL